MYFVHGSLVLTSCSFPFLGLHSGCHSTFISHVSLSSFGYDGLILMTFTVVRRTGQIFCSTSLSWDLTDVSFLFKLHLCALGRKKKRWSGILITSCHGYLFLILLIMGDIKVNHPATAVFLGFLHWKVVLYNALLSMPFYILCSLQGSHYKLHTL